MCLSDDVRLLSDGVRRLLYYGQDVGCAILGRISYWRLDYSTVTVHGVLSP